MALTTVAPTVTATGITAPTYYEIVDYFKEQYKAIYGDDAYLENDSMDGQWIGVIARAISDCNATAVDVYSTFSPKTATGDALTRNVAINGIQRALPTYSTVDLVITGVVGTTINNGYAIDQNSKVWTFPSAVVIPETGTITITATSAEAGAILAMANTVITIGKPTRGWQAVNNPNTSSMGSALELDAELKQRQALSTAIAATSLVDSIEGALLSLSGVLRCKIVQNTTNDRDSNGLPPKSICVIVQGGKAPDIAQVIRSKKSMGCALFGNTQENITNIYDKQEIIAFYRPKITSISYKLQLKARQAYSTDTGESIKQNLAQYTNQLDISDRVMLNKLYGVANLYGAQNNETYDIEAIQILVDGAPVTGNYDLAFGCIANCSANSIEIEVLSA